MSFGARAPAVAALAAGAVHAIAGGTLAAGDPIGELMGPGGAGVVVAAIAVTVARLFLIFVAPGWAVYAVATAIGRARYGPPK